MIHKKRSFFLGLLLCAGIAQAQNVAINTDGSKAHPNAILDIRSADKGLLIPRLTSEARLKISNTQGLLVYDVNTNSFWYNTGRAWVDIAQGTAAKLADSAWLLTGNAGTVDGTNFLGTTDNVPLNFRVNNMKAGRIDPINGNTILGHRSAFLLTTGTFNTALGESALFHVTNGLNNTAIGANALQHNTGFDNTAVGRIALFNNTTGVENTGVGISVLRANRAGSFNTGMGSGAMNSVQGDNNTGIGYNSQWCCGGPAQTENTSVGALALFQIVDARGNTAMGFRALDFLTNGNYNVGIGYSADIDQNNNNSTVVGSFTQALGTNSTALGYGAISNASNKVRIGNAAVTVIEGQVPFTTPSDGRFKFGVQEDVKGLDFILQLRPVTYQFDVKSFDAQLGIDGSASSYTEALSIRRTGFIAQEVEQAALKTGYNFSGIIKPKDPKDHYSLSYDAFVVPLVKGMQEQQQTITEQQKTIREQDKKIADLQQQLDELKNAVKKLQAPH